MNRNYKDGFTFVDIIIFAEWGPGGAVCELPLKVLELEVWSPHVLLVPKPGASSKPFFKNEFLIFFKAG